MSYVAKHYTEIAGCKYTPGEVINTPIAPEKLERLLRLGAVKPLDCAITAPEPDAEETENDFSALDDMVLEDAEEAEEDAEDPVVDVMDGIIAPEPAEEPARKTTSRRKKA